MSSIDARVRYTRMIIEESFLELLSEKPLSRVTVTELCQRAELNRATFYKHYLDIPDLMEKLEEQLFDQLRRLFADHAASFDNFLPDALALIRRNKDKFSILSSRNGDPELMGKAFMVCYERAYPLLTQNPIDLSEEKRLMLYNFLSYGSGGVLNQWMSGGMKETDEEISRFILTLCGQILDGFIR